MAPPTSPWRSSPPRTHERRSGRKCSSTWTAGSRIVWVLEPRDHSVTTYRSRTDVRVLKSDDRLDGFDVLPGFRVPVAELFAPPDFPGD